ncbi:MAG: L,D-transpeptidase family protein [Parcubacteria group bacterium]|jgi:hypothetical protein
MKKSALFFIQELILMFILVPMSFATEIPDGFSSYTLKKGDNLKNIAPEKSWDIIMRVNQIDAQHLTPGKNILIPTDHDNIPIFCPVPSEMPTEKEPPRTIHVFLDTQYFGAYEKGQLQFWGPISSAGKHYNTPKGNFRVIQKMRSYFSKKFDGAPMPYALQISEDGIFIHQQALPGKPASHGCIRLLMSDAKKLFTWSHRGDPVIIH